MKLDYLALTPGHGRVWIRRPFVRLIGTALGAVCWAYIRSIIGTKVRFWNIVHGTDLANIHRHHRVPSRWRRSSCSSCSGSRSLGSLKRADDCKICLRKWQHGVVQAYQHESTGEAVSHRLGWGQLMRRGQTQQRRCQWEAFWDGSKRTIPFNSFPLSVPGILLQENTIRESGSRKEHVSSMFFLQENWVKQRKGSRFQALFLARNIDAAWCRLVMDHMLKWIVSFAEQGHLWLPVACLSASYAWQVA